MGSVTRIKLPNPPCVICGGESDGFYALGGEWPEVACWKCAKPIQDRLNMMDYDTIIPEYEGHRRNV